MSHRKSYKVGHVKKWDLTKQWRHLLLPDPFFLKPAQPGARALALQEPVPSPLATDVRLPGSVSLLTSRRVVSFSTCKKRSLHQRLHGLPEPPRVSWLRPLGTDNSGPQAGAELLAAGMVSRQTARSRTGPEPAQPLK